MITIRLTVDLHYDSAARHADGLIALVREAAKNFPDHDDVHIAPHAIMYNAQVVACDAISKDDEA